MKRKQINQITKGRKMNKQTEAVNKISNLVKQMHNQNAPLTRYSVQEFHDSFRVSNLKVNAEELGSVYFFASANRRHQKTTIKIFANDELLAAQNGIGGQWNVTEAGMIDLTR